MLIHHRLLRFATLHVLCGVAGVFASATAATAGQSEPSERGVPPAIEAKTERPTIFIAGDSTAAASASPEMQGWGEAFIRFFDPMKLTVVNSARGGRSSRTFVTEGLWHTLLSLAKPGDIILIQFGHNDATAIDGAQARGPLPGIGDETRTVVNALTGKTEVVHTFGWYIREMVATAQQTGARPIVVSPTLHNTWHDGQIERSPGDFAVWDAEVAATAHVPFIDLSALEAAEFQRMGQERVGSLYRGKTHFSAEAAGLHASFVLLGLHHLPGQPVNRFLSAAGREALNRFAPERTEPAGVGLAD